MPSFSVKLQALDHLKLAGSRIRSKFEVVKSTGLFSQKSTVSLEIFSFNSADVGDYECVVANEVGKCGCVATHLLRLVLENLISL